MAYDFAAGTNSIGCTFTPPSLPFTMACQFNADSLATADAILCLGVDSARYQIQLDNTAPGNVLARVINGTTNPFATSGSGAAIGGTGLWYNLVAVFTSTTSRTIYVGGAQGNVDTTSASISPTSEFRISGRTSGGVVGACVDGRIAEVGVWNTAFTADDAAMHHQAFTASRIRPENLIFYAPLVRGLQETKAATSLTVSGATVAPQFFRRG
jgi:hypothetical protein